MLRRRSRGATRFNERGLYDHDRFVEYGAATGIAFVIVTIRFAIVMPTPPDLDAPAQEWASYFAAHDGAVRAAPVLVLAGALFFIWFFAVSALITAWPARPRRSVAPASPIGSAARSGARQTGAAARAREERSGTRP